MKPTITLIMGLIALATAHKEASKNFLRMVEREANSGCAPCPDKSRSCESIGCSHQPVDAISKYGPKIPSFSPHWEARSAADGKHKLNSQPYWHVLQDCFLLRRSQDEHEDGFNRQIDESIGEAKELQTRTPWHREGSDKPPVKRMRSAGAMTKGILPNSLHRKSIEPLALLVHPQQPLSYLERLIQSELPMIKSKDGKDKVPEVFFRAEDSAQDEIKADTRDAELEEEEGSDEQMVDGKLIKLGKISNKSDEESGSLEAKQEAIESGLRGGPGEGGVESYSGAGREAESSGEGGEQNFVRWSSSTEIGDFIRDAARGKEFAVEIEGASKEIRVGVPSFNDRTHYLRVRFRKTNKKLAQFAMIKKECDNLAHRSAQRIAMGGFGVLVTWWAAIYHFTFQTSYGWDTMEPITYLAGLSTIMLGYLWFLYHNREVSYQSALNLTVSRRQNALYQARGFDLRKWERLIEEANALRKEIKIVADEYDVEWDEKSDEISEEVHDALKEERDKSKSEKDDKDEDDKDSKRKEKSSKKDD
ncbi:Calcium uniporter [Hyphodiscus hymeniophilus]|uniref:Calcium uniporter protein, mitochondrial n=1 Tax=Hyphodiscus hymeniophilus TaxID=353542 RepID=A0A9P7B194_9HELO|nr:Calcium uniporter [Hyphodiscus hymeniophilus]